MKAVARPFRVRGLALGLVAAGAIAGSLLDAQRVPDPMRVGPYHLIAADFHVHAFPGDGALPPWELAREASRRGLHAIVTSNHNQTVPEIMPGSFSRGARPGTELPLIIPAQEVTTPRFHLVAVGIKTTIDWRGNDLEILDAIHAQGGVVIAAHPIARYWRGSEAMLAQLDGVEVAHPLAESLASGRQQLTAFFERVRAVNSDIAAIGSSDFHMVAPVGVCRTYVFAESVTIAGVLDAIRAGRTVARDTHGALYGDAELVELLHKSGHAPVKRPDWQSSFAAMAVLLALLGSVVFR